MPMSNTFKKLIMEAFKDMSPSEQQDFMFSAMELFFKQKIKASIETKTIEDTEKTMVKEPEP